MAFSLARWRASSRVPTPISPSAPGLPRYTAYALLVTEGTNKALRIIPVTMGSFFAVMCSITLILHIAFDESRISPKILHTK